MSIWNIIWTCTGWIFCHCKTHTFGNECHADCCALSGILFVVELVEGNDHPRQSEPLYFEDLGSNNVVLLLRMIKRYFATGKYVIIDSNLCILKGLIQLSKKGIFDCVNIKKIR